MRKKINGVWYDTVTASLIAETESLTLFSGRMTIGIYRSQSGQWFQCISPTNENSNQAISNWIIPNTAKAWLEKNNFNLQLREYFGTSECRLRPQRQILVAEKKSPYAMNSQDLIQVEKLYHHPQKGWCLKQTKESVLIPMSNAEAAQFVRSLWQKKGHTQSSLPILEQYLYEGEHSQYRRIASWRKKITAFHFQKKVDSMLPERCRCIQQHTDSFYLLLNPYSNLIDKILIVTNLYFNGKQSHKLKINPI